MKVKRMICLLAALMLCILNPAAVFAGERNIYAGDIITLKIAAEKLSENDIREKFREFEIVGITGSRDEYVLELRTFEPGEYSVVIGDKEIVISVASTLEDIDREGLFEGSGITEPGFSFYLHIIFVCAVSVFSVSGGFALFKFFRKGKAKKEEPYRLFQRRIAALSTEDDSYFADLTFYFKEYIGCRYGRRITGKTSSEIVRELGEMQLPEDIISDAREWLGECDMLKFSGTVADDGIKQHHNERLSDIAGKAETHRRKVKEGIA